MSTCIRSGKSFLDLTLGQFFFFLLFNCLLFEDPIQYASGITWIDEFASLALFIAGCCYTTKNGKTEGIIPVAVSVLCLLAITFLGTVFAGVGQPVFAVLIDAFAYIKFPIAILGAVMLAGYLGSLKRFLVIEAKILSVTLLVLGIGNLFVDFGMRLPGGGRYWGVSFLGVWRQPTVLVAVCVCMISFLVGDGPRENILYILSSCLVIILTQRSKGFAAVGVLLILLVVVERRNPRLNFAGLLVILFGGIAIGWDAFVLYFGTSGFARSELLRGGFELAIDHIPLGTGFATFGSAVSGDYYSPLYSQLGLSQVYGLTPNDHGFLSDTFWPTVAGQSGFLGMGLYVLFIALVFRLVKGRSDSKATFISLVYPLIYLLISSSSEAAFFAPFSIALAFTVGVGAAGTGAVKSLSHD